MHPVGPHSSAVYWVRRVVLIVIAVALVIGLVWWMTARASTGSDQADADTVETSVTTTSTPPVLTGVLAAPTLSDDIYDDLPDDETTADEDDEGDDEGTGPVTISGSDAPTTAQTAEDEASDTAESDTSEKKAATTTETTSKKKKADKTAEQKTEKTKKKKAAKTTEPPPPSYDASGRLICPDTSISIAAITWGESYPAGSQPRLGMAVTNTGPQSCIRDLSGTLQTYTVYTAKGDRVWSTDDCFPGEGTETRQLAPGATANFIIVWAGTTSEPGCATPRIPVSTGKYELVAKLGALKSKKHPFEIR